MVKAFSKDFLFMVLLYCFGCILLLKHKDLLMSEYANQLNIQIAEVVRLTFNDMSAQGELMDSVQIVVHVDFLKALNDTITKAMSDHAAMLAQQVEANKKMN